MASVAQPPLELTKNQFLHRPKHQQSFSLLLHKPLKLHHLKEIQAQLFRRTLDQDNILITKLINGLASSGSIDYAMIVFDTIKEPDLVLCNTMLKGWILNQLFKEALSLYILVLERGFWGDQFTFPYVLKACYSLQNISIGRAIHSIAAKTGYQADVFVQNSLIDMYLKCGDFESAMLVFEKTQNPNSTSWNLIVKSSANRGDIETARNVFDEMPERDIASWNTMLSAYAKMGDIKNARKVFDEMPQRNLVSWNAMIAGYEKNGHFDCALSLFAEMRETGSRPDNATMLSVLSAAVEAADIEMANKLLDYLDVCFSSKSFSLLTTVMNLHAKFGRLREARQVFDEMPKRDVVVWNAMIGGYAQNQKPSKALELFREMQSKGVEPDEMTLVSVLSSCGQLGALALGEWVHSYIKRNCVKLDIFLSTSLVDMYAKCGDLKRAREVFNGMTNRDVASWNAMIRGLAMHGHGNDALSLFSMMEIEGTAPNCITFIGVLNACSHEGLVARGSELFESMQFKYKIRPRIEHYGCMVDLFGRAGLLKEAQEFIRAMPIEPDNVVWAALLNACRIHKDFELAERVAQHLIDLDPLHDGNYVLLSNIYAASSKWAEVEKVRERMSMRGVRKTPGVSSVEVNGTVHEFTAGDKSHPQAQDIYLAWDELVERLKGLSYSPDTGSILRNMDEEDKEEALYRHSEKLAITFRS
ncbi:hypothetical protein AMTRI_Chr02g221900 [Amborella trichopoda]